MAKGYRPRHRNWRGAGGEIDLVMRKRDTTVFVEVKARSDTSISAVPVRHISITSKKQEVLTKDLIAAYLGRFNLWQLPCRFDLVTVERVGGLFPWRIRHYQRRFPTKSRKTILIRRAREGGKPPLQGDSAPLFVGAGCNPLALLR